MMSLSAPAASPENVLLLQNPIFEDTEGLNSSINISKAVDGSRYSYVKKSSERQLSFTFESVGRGKIVEIEAFFRKHSANLIRLETFRNESWDVYLVDQPEFSINLRSAPAGGPRQESGNFTLEFIGVKL